MREHSIYKFNSQYRVGEEFFPKSIFEKEKLIKEEPMFFNSGYDFAMERGGPVTRSFLEAVPRAWREHGVVFDSRVHMLMEGWYPAIPGWHHDDVPRSEDGGQPNYDTPEYHAEHIMGLVNGEICPTQFAVGECALLGVSDGEVIYKHWHEEVEKLIKQGTLVREEAPDRRLIYFDAHTFHTGVKAIKGGWRWFGRLSRHTDRIQKITNEIRKQVQVYLEFPMEGW